MSPDPARTAEAREWLEKAGADLRAAAWDLGAEPPLVEDALFHCQQAIEKVLKGFLAWNDRRFRKTHSIEELGEACAGIDPDLGPLVDEAVPMTEYAWVFRYPGAPPVPDLDEAREAFRLTRQLVREVAGRLPPEAVPSSLH